MADSVGPHLHIAAKSARMLLERHLTQARASFGTWTVLAMLESAGPMIQRALAASLGIEGPTLTRHLDRLEELGLIRRNRDGADRRYALVELTPAGRTLCQELDALARAANDELLGGFSEEETRRPLPPGLDGPGDAVVDRQQTLVGPMSHVVDVEAL